MTDHFSLAGRKATAEGALLWFIKQFVMARASRSTYGVEASVPFNPNLPSHRAREHLAIEDSEGRKITGVFEACVFKVSALNPSLS